MPKSLSSRCKELVASLINYSEKECDGPLKSVREVLYNGVTSSTKESSEIRNGFVQICIAKNKSSDAVSTAFMGIKL
ncbi:unnamed protein product [Acanthoscelides obtectus]|uniref:Uncharacterized protein n=1 Tax=Acanthoscelides obtectus TaxID=200917 RepID=A0A9P0Q193_ACAOB|nr:unnamed protein product [Acanthoscelides obtectus]CAK1657693.1 hypothetical protein AOBTE_LOCUS20484 [Acanthoscelides obtectus]